MFFFNLYQLCWFYIKKGRNCTKAPRKQQEEENNIRKAAGEKKGMENENRVQGAGREGLWAAHGAILARFFLPHTLSIH
jgi:hypothetical protein